MTKEAKNRRRGAPRKVPEETRSRVVTVRLTPAEYDHLRALAERSAKRVGKARKPPLGQFLAERVLSRAPKTIPAINQTMWSYLGHWAGAFTTIANAAAGQRLAELLPHLQPELIVAIDQLRTEFQATRLALLGLDAKAEGTAGEQPSRGKGRNGKGGKEADSYDEDEDGDADGEGFAEDGPGGWSAP